MSTKAKKLPTIKLVVALMLLLVSVCSAFFFVPTKKVEAADCGAVLVGGSSWMGGNGVDVHSNGADEGTANDCKTNNPTASYDPYYNINPDSQHNGGVAQYGNGWQCVELVQRLYQTRGWTSGIWKNVDYAAEIYSNASANGWTTMANGSITLSSVVPGDMIVTKEATYGHVMAVDSVDTTNNVIHTVDQNGADGGRTDVTYNPTTKTLSDGTYFVFSGIVHSPNNKLTNGSSGGSQPSTPVAVSRTSTTMAVFYDDGNGGLVNKSWDLNTGWTSYTWHDTFGTNGSDHIVGQPCAVVRDANDMDVFYRTTQGRLIHRGWNVTNSWEGPDVLVASNDVSDPACVSRDSGDLQVFYLTAAGEVKSVSWNSSTGWNTNPQLLYGSAATGDPVAVSRGSDSMEVFFQKNNGNLVHLGWSSEYGWITQDWTTGAGMTGKPTAITRNGGGDMSCYYQETNGRVAEESWDWQLGWNWQDWSAQLVGSPSAVAGTTNVIDVFYRETGGNIVDRYFTGSGWATTNIVGGNGATGNPYAITRGTNEDVFFWNGTTLMDANWNTSTWNVAPVSG